MRCHQKIKVLFLTRYDRSRASSRVRVYDYLPYLRRMGFQCRILPFPKRLTNVSKYHYIIQAFRLAHWADVVVLQKLVLRERFIDILRRVNPRLIFDFDDALWAPPDIHSHNPKVLAWRRIQTERLHYILSLAVRVVTGSHYLASYARQFTRQVEVIPSSVDLERYPLKTVSDIKRVTLGWIGSPENLVDLEAILPILRKIAKCKKVMIKIVSSRAPQITNIPIQFERWVVDHDIEYLHSFDIGLMPLNDTERSRGRCGFKAVQYMAVGLPVIASNVGSAGEVVVHQETGFIASSKEEWEKYLTLLISDKELRSRLGKAGRKRVEAYFSIQANAPKWAEILQEVVYS